MVWLGLIGLILLFGGMGFGAGFASAACGLLIVIVGFFIAGPLTSLTAMVLPKNFTGHFLASWFPNSMYYMELFVALFVLYLVAWGFGFWVNSKIDFWLKHLATELQRRTWAYLDRGAGVFLGICTGVIFILIIATGSYAPGYLCAQTTSSNDDQPWGVAYLNDFAKGMQANGLDKIAARWDKTPKKYFEACDLVGLIASNPQVMYRVEHYPLVYAMADQDEVSGVLRDQGLSDILKGRKGAWAIFNNGSVQTFLNSAAYAQLRDELDQKDFVEYLKTGKSAKYDNFKILGDWELDVDRLILMTKKGMPGITSKEMSYLRMILSEYFKDAKLRATADKRLKLTDVTENMGEMIHIVTDNSYADTKSKELVNAAVAEEVAQQRAVTQSQQQQQPQHRSRGGILSTSRYREALNHNAQTQAMMNDEQPVYDDEGNVVQKPKLERKKIVDLGSWSGDGELYKVRFGNLEMEALIEGDVLVFALNKEKLVYFIRKY